MQVKSTIYLVIFVLALSIAAKGEEPVEARPFDLSAGLSFGAATLNATDSSNGGQANLGAITSGLRIEGFRDLQTMEHTVEVEIRYSSFSTFSTTRLINLSQNIFPGANWHTRFVDKGSRFSWIVGGGIDSVPYYSTLAVTTVTIDGAYSLQAYGGARLDLLDLDSIYLRNVEAHVGVQFPFLTKGYQGGLGFWQRFRAVFERPWGNSQDRSLVGWLDVTHSNESTNLESQSQLSIAAWIFAKWRFDSK